MTAMAMNEMDTQNLLKVMNRMRSLVEPSPDVPACREVNWNEPHHYGAEHKEALAEMGEKLAASLQRTLQYHCDETFAVRAADLSEHFACNLASAVKPARKDWFYLPLLSGDKGQIGYMELSFESAAYLVGQMLRDPEAKIGVGGEMSALEQSILLDILLSLADGLIEQFDEYGIKILKTDQLVQGEWPMRFRELQDMTRFEFNAECGEAKLTAGICLLDEALDAAAGVSRASHSPEEIKKYPERVVSRMHDASMQVTAQLSSTTMTLSDMLSLEAGDVVVLGQKADCPISMLVNGQTCFKAWPAQHAGRMAVQVTSLE